MESPGGAMLRADAIRNAAEYSRSRNGHALLIRQWGKTLHESYGSGFGANTTQKVFSITKSLTAMACFVAASERWINLDESVADTITEWKKDPKKRTITVRMLLNQTAGISPGFPELYDRRIKDKGARAIRFPVVAIPGTQFDYGPAYFEILEVFLSRKLKPRGLTVQRFMETRVLMPVRAHADRAWHIDGSGNIYLSTGAQMTARGVAAVAGVVLSRGRAGLHTVFSSKFIAEAMQGSMANRMYGLSFWNNQNASRISARELSVEGTLGREFSPEFWQDACLSKNAPADLLAMVGSGGQRAYVVPSQGLVIVRFGSGGRFDDAEFLDVLFTRLRPQK